MVQPAVRDDDSEGPTAPTGLRWRLEVTWARTLFKWNQLKWILKNFRRWRESDALIEGMKEDYLKALRTNVYPDPDPDAPDSWFKNFLRLYDAALERRDLGQLTVWWEYHERAGWEFQWRSFWTTARIEESHREIGKLNRGLFGMCIRYKLDVGLALRFLESIEGRWPGEVQISDVNGILVHLIERKSRENLGERKYEAQSSDRRKRWKTPNELYTEIRKQAAEIIPEDQKLPINLQFASVWDMPDDMFRAFLMTRWSDIDLRNLVSLP